LQCRFAVLIDILYGCDGQTLYTRLRLSEDGRAQEAPHRKRCEESDYIDYNVCGLTWKSGEGATNLRMQLDWRSINVIAMPLVVRDSRM
jgi:hypothetical protein